MTKIEATSITLHLPESKAPNRCVGRNLFKAADMLLGRVAWAEGSPDLVVPFVIEYADGFCYDGEINEPGLANHVRNFAAVHAGQLRPVRMDEEVYQERLSAMSEDDAETWRRFYAEYQIGDEL